MQNRKDFTPMVPFMPENPMYYHAYVPYQIDIEELPLCDALEKGSLYEALYSPFDGTTPGGTTLC